MTLPNPPQNYDPRWAAEMKRELEAQLDATNKRGQDIEVATSNVWLTSPDGQRYSLTVANDGTLTTAPAAGAALPPPPPPPVGYRDGSASIESASSVSVVASVGVRLYQDGAAAISSQSTVSANGTIATGSANLLTYSEQLNATAWKASLASGYPTIERNVSNDAAGGLTMEELTTNFSGSYYARQHITGLVPEQTYTFHLEVQQGRTGSATNVRLTTNNTAAWNTGSSASYALTSTPTRRSVTWTQLDTTSAAIMVGAVGVDGNGDAACLGTMRIGRAMVNVGASPATYVSTGESEDISGSGGAPAKVFGIYFESYHAWRPAPTPQIQDIPTQFNVIYLFNLRFNSNGSARWESGSDVTNAEIQTVRARGQKVVLTLGGSGITFIYTDRAQSQALVNSLYTIIDSMGGVDGIDWNNYEGGVLTDSNRAAFATELIWIVGQLRARYGSNFMCTSPAATAPNDQWALQQLNNAGLLTYAAPQFYDWSGYSDVGRIKSQVDSWVSILGDASKVVVGFPADYLSRWDGGLGPDTAVCQREWDAIKAAHPTIRGCFGWSSTSASGAQRTEYGYTYTESRITPSQAWKWITDMYARVTS